MQKLGCIAYFIALCFSLPFAARAQGTAPVQPVDGLYIREWLLLGPLFPDNLEEDFLSAAGGEAAAYPTEGDIVITSLGETLSWRRFSSNRSIIDLQGAIGQYRDATSYAYCTLYAPAAGKHQILLGSDDGVAVWINGVQVHSHPVGRPLFLDQDAFEVDLLKGKNLCLVKISQQSGGWGFSMRIIPRDQFVSVPPKLYLSSENLRDEIPLYNIPWKYSPGDDEGWSAADYDDSSW